MADMGVVIAPGRVNLIGEHIDYHGLPVLPMAIGRRIRLTFRRRGDRLIRASSEGYGVREFHWERQLEPVAAGDWENYLRAAAQAVAGKWGVGAGMDAEISSDLPPAAGLSSSSALMVTAALGLLRANRYNPTFEELMEVLPEGEHFVGTRGGGMDHAASLSSRAGCASLIGFEPLKVRHIPIPGDWRFLIAHSLVTAEKSAGTREAYNARRAEGARELERLGFRTFREAVKDAPQSECGAFEHVTSEAGRVEAAVAAIERGDAAAFGRLLAESHASLRDRLGVSCRALDRLVDAAMASGAAGARLTGAGFGGCAVILCGPDRDAVCEGLKERFYSRQTGFDESLHLIDARPSAGALSTEGT
jgi:galactokinase